MKLYNSLLIIGLTIFANSVASTSSFFGENDRRQQLFKVLDDHVANIKIEMPQETWDLMKASSVMAYTDDFSVLENNRITTSNATLEFYVEGTDYKVSLNPGDFDFGLGGKTSRFLAKPGYNIKIHGDDNAIYGVKKLRIRSIIRDASQMREKLSSDILQLMDVPTTSTGYINLEINGEFMGLYLLTNKIKKDFIKYYYGESKPKNLYDCKLDKTRFEDNTVVTQCENVDEKLTDKTELQSFVDAVNQAKSAEELEAFLDTEAVLKSFAFEFITVAWDNFLAFNHNYFLYKQTNGKWTMIINDFDYTFGQEFWSTHFQGNGVYVNKDYIPDATHVNIFNFSIRDCDLGHKLVTLLILNDDTRFREIIADVVKKAFNPQLLLPHIDAIKDLIYDSIVADRQFDDKFNGPGRINSLGKFVRWNVTHFIDTTEYTSWADLPNNCRSYALKLFIEERFKYLCHTYGINPDTLEKIEPRPKVAFWGILNKYEMVYDRNPDEGPTKFSFPNLDKEDYKQEAYNADPETNDHPVGYNYSPTIHEINANNTDGNGNDNEKDTISTQIPSTVTSTTTINPESTSNSEVTSSTPEECWSQRLGYNCCTTSCYIYEKDQDGNWGYENNEWCGIPSSCIEDQCWSKKLGYECCTGDDEGHIFVVEEDKDGQWGYENGHWCGIKN